MNPSALLSDAIACLPNSDVKLYCSFTIYSSGSRSVFKISRKRRSFYDDDDNGRFFESEDHRGRVSCLGAASFLVAVQAEP